jgi:transposase
VRPARAGRQDRPHATAADPTAGHLRRGSADRSQAAGRDPQRGPVRLGAAFAAHTGTAPIPVSSGNTQRHRLSRSGNRQLNRALFTIAMWQARWDPNARAYLARKRTQGKSPAEARRCLKRHLADVVYRAMVADAQALRATPTPTA